MPTIVTSDMDLASMNIRSQLTKLFGFKKQLGKAEFDGNPIYTSDGIPLISSKRELVDSDHIEEALKTDLLIFASRHRSAAGKPALLVHCTGNWTGEAELGGKPYELAVAPASAMKEALWELAKQKKELGLENYEVAMECTHHGPTSMSTPLLFVELGSDKEHWADEVAARAVAKAVYKVAHGVKLVKTALGIGGPHYAPNFTKVDFSPASEIAVGHIIPTYVFQSLRKEMVQKAIERTLEKVELVLLDWKGLRAEHREFIKPILDELGLETLRTYEVTRSS
nr:D-aminoacyl-tRNA deacylase [Candidatus Njordarchaeota archaeon]